MPYDSVTNPPSHVHLSACFSLHLLMDWHRGEPALNDSGTILASLVSRPSVGLQ